jgi:hypothetical protein
VTANNVSSAPSTTAHEYDADYDDDDASEAARHTEEFLASLMYAANAEEDGYISPGHGPVQINAHMMNDADSLWMLSNTDPPSTSSAPEAHTDRWSAPHNNQDTSVVSSMPHRPSSLFDDCYVAGKHTNPAGVHGVTPGRYPHNQLRLTGAINPSARPAEVPLTYLQAFHTDLTTVQDANRHEARIFQHGYTPDEIRRNIKLILRMAPSDQHRPSFKSRTSRPHL